MRTVGKIPLTQKANKDVIPADAECWVWMHKRPLFRQPLGAQKVLEAADSIISIKHTNTDQELCSQTTLNIKTEQVTIKYIPEEMQN